MFVAHGECYNDIYIVLLDDKYYNKIIIQ